MKPTEERVWEKYYPKDFANHPFKKQTMYNALVEGCKDLLDENALNYYGKTWTYREVLQKIDIYARAFKKAGLKPGECVTMCTTSIPESIYMLYAVNKMGATMNIIDPRKDAENLETFYKLSDSKILIGMDVFCDKIESVAKKLNLPLVIMQSAGQSMGPLMRMGMKLTMKPGKPTYKNTVTCADFEKTGLAGEDVPEAPYDENRTTLILQTGGTTGDAKSVELTDDGPNAVLYGFRYSGVEYTHKDRFLDVIPMFASYGVIGAIHMPLCMGCEMCITPEYSMEKFPKQVMDFKPNHTLAVPSFYDELMHNKLTKNADLSFFINYGTGGDTVNAELEKDLRDFMLARGAKYPMAQGYGMTECSSAITMCFGDHVKSQSSGIPFAGATVAVFDPDTQEELDYNQVGEICMCGPSLMKGYLKRPEESAHALRVHKDGKTWLHSGDLGHMDEDGFIYIEGRIKRIIVRFNGHKDFPAQLEEAVQTHPNVRNVAIPAVKDRSHAQGYLPLIAVTLNEEADHAKMREEILQICRERIAAPSQPADVVFVDEFPLTPVGKIDVKVLEEQFKDFHYENIQ